MKSPHIQPLIKTWGKFYLIDPDTYRRWITTMAFAAPVAQRVNLSVPSRMNASASVASSKKASVFVGTRLDSRRAVQAVRGRDIVLSVNARGAKAAGAQQIQVCSFTIIRRHWQWICVIGDIAARLKSKVPEFELFYSTQFCPHIPMQVDVDKPLGLQLEQGKNGLRVKSASGNAAKAGISSGDTGKFYHRYFSAFCQVHQSLPTFTWILTTIYTNLQSSTPLPSSVMSSGPLTSWWVDTI